MKKFILVLVVLVSGNLIAQSAWTQKKGKTYTQLSYSTISDYDRLFGEPDYNTERKITDNTIQLYGEYGLTDKTTLLLNLPLKLIKTGDQVFNTVPVTTATNKTALGNIEIGIKHLLYNKAFTLSGQLSIEANTSTFDDNSGIRTGYDAWSFTPTLNAGKSFGKMYAQAFVGGNIRTNDYSSNFKFGAEYGIKFIQRIWVIGYLDFVSSFNNGDIILPESNLLTGLYVNNQEYSAYGVKGIVEINENFGASAGFGGAFSGNNVARQAAISFGLYHKL
ncbi:MAG: hypothetical protein KC469_10245 [Flavobacteriaceae bacterium]|nr:hypothetical protein [Flavobacteriaceae bacterium]